MLHKQQKGFEPKRARFTKDNIPDCNLFQSKLPSSIISELFISLSVHFKNILNLTSGFSENSACAGLLPSQIQQSYTLNATTSLLTACFSTFRWSPGAFKIISRSDYIMSFLLLPMKWNVISINFYSLLGPLGSISLTSLQIKGLQKQ